MSLVHFHSVSFHYSQPCKAVFDDLNLSIDTTWKSGLVARNGRGKTTLLQLINGGLEPVRGSIHRPVPASYFPYAADGLYPDTFSIIKESIAPFHKWEEDMRRLITKEDEESLIRYSEALEAYTKAGGYEIEADIEKQFKGIGLSLDLLKRDFSSLSGGEKTKSLLCALFLKKDSYPLIDEPTNHLDLRGRLDLGEYLSRQSGFLLVSHDRYFLDLCTDHIIAIEKSGVSVQKGNFSQWKYDRDIKEQYEERRSENIRRDVKRLKEAALERRKWSQSAEKEKLKKGKSEGGMDKGYLGAVSAKLMKRALGIERRIQENLSAKMKLLKNKEKSYRLKLENGGGPDKILLQVRNLTVSFNERKVIDNISFTLRHGGRLAVLGPNGCGKTTLFRAIGKELDVYEGMIFLPKTARMEWVKQKPSGTEQNIRKIIEREFLDENKLRNVLAAMGLKGDILDTDLDLFSDGEKKKIALSLSFAKPCDLLLWDEPLNAIDLMGREQLEEVVLEYQPTLLFIEHDRYFIDKIATEIISLG